LFFALRFCPLVGLINFGFGRNAELHNAEIGKALLLMMEIHQAKRKRTAQRECFSIKTFSALPLD